MVKDNDGEKDNGDGEWTVNDERRDEEGVKNKKKAKEKDKDKDIYI